MQSRHRHARAVSRAEAIRHARLKFRLQRRALHRGPNLWHALGVAAGLALASVIALLTTATLGAPAALAFTSDRFGAYLELPNPNELSSRTTQFNSTRILDRDGELLYELFDPNAGRRTRVPLNEMPRAVISATIATEDRTFFENRGVDYQGILRAAFLNLTGTGEGGGSTITQQLIRNVLIPEAERKAELDPSLSRAERERLRYLRKLKEILLAVQIDRLYTKEQILEMYLNEIYYGNLSYGIEAAAQGYFGKSVRELTLAEATLLAGLPQSPVEYDPTVNPRAARERQSDVLELMRRAGYISAEEADRIRNEPLTFRAARFDIKAPHFVFYVRDLLQERYGSERLYRGGLTVYTTLDLDLQREAERIVKRHIDSVSRFNARNAALVAIDPKTGEILAMVGSVDYFDRDIDGQVNVAIAERQPGSSIKPITYVTAFKKGYTPATVLLDEPITIPDGQGKPFSPKNNDGKFRGPVKLRNALATSLNIPAIKVLQFAGLTDTVEMARSMGITSFKDPARYGLSLTLGGGEVRLLELTAAYGVFASGGIYHPPTAILKVVDLDGRTLFQYQPKDDRRPLTPELAYLITDILADNAARAPEFGFDSPLRLSRPAAAKTGTTDDSRDAWTIGYTPDLVTGVWVGNSNNAPMMNLLGSRAAGPIWHDFMEYAHRNRAVKNFPRPPGIITVSVCAERNEKGECSSTSSDIYIQGIEPKTPVELYAKRMLVCKLDGKLADSGCRPDEVELRSFLPPNLTDVPQEIRNLGLPPIPTEYCACFSGPRPTGTVTATATITASATLTGTPTASGTRTPAPTATPRPTDTPRPAATATPIPAAAGPAAIVAPASGSLVNGTVNILGTAAGPDFAAYKLEVGQGEAPVQRRTIAEGVRPVENGLLGSWATGGSPNTVHSIILTVYDRTGRAAESRVIVRVAN
ncbi:MAG: PBP1A family penicillin-binding protein [Chloroflexota bacterium]|nr:PBP1A family penicillin-binding protein [Dehalococcoidia bacterium]MDW8252416.1 PBP1A family penicillin-binding protein [Chloroflexota bacterium]